jgi:fatty acid desaturase
MRKSNLSESLTPAQRIKNIQKSIRLADAEVRAKYSFLKHQNTIGLCICLLSLAGMVATGAAYIGGLIPAWLCIVVATVFASISHELEHDLIHKLYFKDNRFVQNLMMAIVWLMRPNTINPWYRRTIHVNHHKKSGTEDDIEERVIGNGMKFGFKRILISLDGFLSISLRRKELRSMKNYGYLQFVRSGAPLAPVYIICLYGFAVFHLYNNLAPALGLSTDYSLWFLSLINVLNIVAVVWILPNALRAFCLHSITTLMHYYGDVDSLLKQCQVMNHWALLPIHLLSFNFGSTHTIHHFLVTQPFYLRQMVASKVYPVMKENGIRFNDFASLFRANRFTQEAV